MNKAFFTILLLVILSIKVFGIDFPKAYTLRDDIHFQDSNSLYFKFYNCNFLWNNEYFNKNVKGYTLIGYFITPTLQYHFNENIKVEAGIHFLKYSGLDKYSVNVPVYSATYHKNDFAFVMGTLYGTVNHRLSEPMYFFEQYFTNNLENGVQAVWNKNKFYLDVWLDWRSFIFENDAKQEELTAGISSVSHIKKNEAWELSIPASLLMTHRGGQIDTTEANMKTAMNYSFGLNIKKKLENRLFNQIETEFLRLGFSDNSPTVESLYEQGYGYLTSLKLSHKDHFLQFAYWYGYEFLSMQGNPMYQSYYVEGDKYDEWARQIEFAKLYGTEFLKWKDKPIYQYTFVQAKGYHQRERQLITAKLFLSKTIYENINLSFTGESYWDIVTNDLDFTMGFTLLIKHDFFLKRFNKKASS